MKTLNDFKQEVAIEYGLLDWEDLKGQIDNSETYSDLAAERYAEYRAKEAREEGFFEGDKLTADLLNRYEVKG